MDNGGLSNEALALMIFDIIRVHQLRIICYLQAHGMLADVEQGEDERRVRRKFSRLERIPAQVHHLTRLVGLNDKECIDNLRMDRNCFGRLCLLLREQADLVDGKYVYVEEQIAMFLGAIDGTYINVLVGSDDKPRYRNKKGQIATNTLAVCTRDMRFVYVLAGWEGSARDARVLRDAVTCPHGIKVLKGQYYLCDNGYANSERFLTPYKGVRYHLQEWGPAAMVPENPKEMYNMCHTKARNVIERAFAVVKMRWGILRSASFYPITTQIRLTLSCFLLHNFIRDQMTVDPIEQELDVEHIHLGLEEEQPEHNVYVDTVDPTPAWNNKLNEFAETMWLSAAFKVAFVVVCDSMFVVMVCDYSL
ncbi:uncharacterized protein LOC121754504 [Salvia splendens]|uniref:uncharacterized protein LOC121754504 n=1 Tax=Salvia splendens TaxID=180675 RepID=UPI001C2694AA|nr:uncharacterized protein LOC121754504 [Salvia splendens]